MGSGSEYATITVLGTGTFGVVKKVRHVTDNKFYACKVIRFREGEISLAETDREYAVLKRLNHPHIVRYIDYRWQRDKAKLYMEYCPGGDLRQFILHSKRMRRPISETEVWSVLSQIASALKYCHYGVHTTPDGRSPPAATIHDWKPIIHRDIKPANILIDTNHDNEIVVVKLGDFGVSRIVDSDTMPASYAGTRQYQPPEISRANPSGIKWTKKCDIFSLGCTLYEMCTWNAPFSWRMEESDVFKTIPSSYSHRLQKCIDSCLAFHSEDRPDAFDLLSQVQRTRGDPETRRFIRNLPDVPPAPRDKFLTPEAPEDPGLEQRPMPGAFVVLTPTSTNELVDTIKTRPVKETSIRDRAIHGQRLSEPLTVVNMETKVGQYETTQSAVEPGTNKPVQEKPLKLRASCPLCGLKFPESNDSLFSDEIQDHFEKFHTKRHGRHRCVVDGCTFSKGAGIYSEAALSAHSISAHGWRAAEGVKPTGRARRSIGAAPSTVAELTPTSDRWYCLIPECQYGPGKFTGFFASDTRDQHMLSHKVGETRAAKAKQLGREIREAQKQRKDIVEKQAHDIKPFREDLHVRTTGDKFYCSSSRCPYSFENFVGFHSSGQALQHVVSHQGQDPSKSVRFISVNEDGKADFPESSSASAPTQFGARTTTAYDVNVLVSNPTSAIGGSNSTNLEQRASEALTRPLSEDRGTEYQVSAPRGFRSRIRRTFLELFDP